MGGGGAEPWPELRWIVVDASSETTAPLVAAAASATTKAAAANAANAAGAGDKSGGGGGTGAAGPSTPPAFLQFTSGSTSEPKGVVRLPPRGARSGKGARF